ncbi:MAG: IS4 family transposase [Shewanella sp.]|nr:IS4 family transposase [Shewanella sp.]
MNTHTKHRTVDSASELLRQFAQTEEDALSAILTTQNLEYFQNQSTQRSRKYPACTTLSIFMKQVASENKSCRSALISHARDQIALGHEINETSTGPYCQARQRLPENAIKSLLRTSGKNLDNSTSSDYLWHNRRVVLTDGSKLSMPDTPENQIEYPQPKSQKKDLGFPQLRILVLIALGSGAVLDSDVAACKGKGTGEQALLRQMHSTLKVGDILLGDANFENYFSLTQLLQSGVDAVFEKNGARNVDFRTCHEKLGKKDGLFKLERPPKPEWMSEEIYSQQPEELTVRMVKHKKRVIVTTLTDAKAYSVKALIELYISRWHVELDFRSIKTMMKMDILRCGSPDMVRKEIDVHLLVYNMIRALMVRAAKKKA